MIATIILLVHTQPIDALAVLASQTLLAASDLRQLRVQLVADAGAALVALLVATTLSVYKPWSMTAYGRANEAARTPNAGSAARTPWEWFWLAGLIAVVVLFAYLHLIDGIHQH